MVIRPYTSKDTRSPLDSWGFTPLLAESSAVLDKVANYSQHCHKLWQHDQRGVSSGWQILHWKLSGTRISYLVLGTAWVG